MAIDFTCCFGFVILILIYVFLYKVFHFHIMTSPFFASHDTLPSILQYFVYYFNELLGNPSNSSFL